MDTVLGRKQCTSTINWSLLFQNQIAEAHLHASSIDPTRVFSFRPCVTFKINFHSHPRLHHFKRQQYQSSIMTLVPSIAEKGSQEII